MLKLEFASISLLHVISTHNPAVPSFNLLADAPRNIELLTIDPDLRCSQISYPTASIPASTISLPNPSSKGNPVASRDVSRNIWRELKGSARGSRSNRPR